MLETSEKTIGKQSQIFDPLVEASKETLVNPYPVLNKMREQGDVIWSPKGNQWLVLGYEQAYWILRSNKFGKELFRWRHPSFLMRQLIKVLRGRSQQSILLMDPPDHTRLRSLVASAFTPKVVRTLEERMYDITDDLLNDMERSFASLGSVDLVGSFAFQLPVIVIAELLGVPAKDRSRFKSWSSRITLGLEGFMSPFKIVNSMLAMTELRSYLRGVIEKKRVDPGDDLISSLLSVQADEPQRLSDTEMLANIVLILIAGHETTVNLISNSVVSLLRHPEQMELLRCDPLSRVASVVEEVQ